MNLCIGLYIVWTIHLMLFGFCKPPMPPLPSRLVISWEPSCVPMDKTMISYGIIEHGRLVDVKPTYQDLERDSYPAVLLVRCSEKFLQQRCPTAYTNCRQHAFMSELGSRTNALVQRDLAYRNARPSLRCYANWPTFTTIAVPMRACGQFRLRCQVQLS